MEIPLKGNGKIIKLMDMGFYKESNYTKEIGIKIFQKDKGLLDFKTLQNIKDYF